MGSLANDRRVPALSALRQTAQNRAIQVIFSTVLINVPDTARIMQKVSFGPIAIIDPVTALDDAITRANSTPFGRVGYAFTTTQIKSNA